MIIDNKELPIPWKPLNKPLSDCRLALVTTAGVHLADQNPFDVSATEGDASYRLLPSNTPFNAYRISHTHYDHSEADKDINCVFPVTRVQELVKKGFLGSLAPTNFGFMGFILKPLLETLKTNAQQVARKLLEQGVDAVLLTPG